MKEYINFIVSAIGAILGYFFGDIDGFVHALMALAILDYITGMLAAFVRRELCSSTGFRGIAKKITMFIVVGVVHIADRELLGGTALLRDAAIFFYLSNEGLSIFENAIEIGVPIPEVVKEKLLAFQNKDDKKNK